MLTRNIGQNLIHQRKLLIYQIKFLQICQMKMIIYQIHNFADLSIQGLLIYQMKTDHSSNKNFVDL